MARPGLSFSHFGIYVTDIDTMEDFYSNVLEFTVTDKEVGEARTIVFMSRDPDEHHQIVIASGRPADLSYNVINQISFRCDSLATLKEFNRRLLADPRVTNVQTVTHGNALSVYGLDPEGNRLEIFWDLPYYTSQPERIPFDLDRPDEEIIADAERISRGLPRFTTREDWRARISAEMGIEA